VTYLAPIVNGYDVTRAALRLRGFRPLRQDLWIRPDNLRGGVQVVAADLVALGLAKDSIVFNCFELQRG